MIGLPVFLGVKTSSNQVLVQGDGNAFRIKTGDFLEEYENGGLLSKILLRNAHALFAQVSQTLACNRFHRIEDSLKCRLLLMHDRMKADNFRITQNFLSKMFGVRREAINKSASILQQQNLISYNRGIVSIVNRAALESEACKCYAVLSKRNMKICLKT